MINWIYIIAGIVSLLFSCNTVNDQSNINIALKGVEVETLSDGYSILLSENGYPSDLSYYYDNKKSKAYVYQFYSDYDQECFILRYDLVNNLKYSIADTIKFELPQKDLGILYISYYVINSDDVILNIGYKDRTGILLSNNSGLEVGERKYQGTPMRLYSRILHKVYQPKYLIDYFTVLTQSSEELEELKLSCFISNKNQKMKRIWRHEYLRNDVESDLFGFLSNHRTLYFEDKIYHLHLDANVIHELSTSTGEKKTISLNTDLQIKDFTKPLTQFKKEEDYWTDILYNENTKEFYLFRHKGYPFYEDDNITIAKNSEDDNMELIYVYDQSFSLKKIIPIKYKYKGKFDGGKYPSPRGFYCFDFISLDKEQNTANMKLNEVVLVDDDEKLD